MEPKVKANELVEKFRKYSKIGIDSPVTGRTENAIKCAIICVEQILDGYRKILPSSRKYWEDVLNEIKAMNPSVNLF